VADGVILDLKYEARDVPQRLTSQAAIDNWFEHKTRGLNGFQKAVLRKRWATMEELMSAAERKQRIIASIIEDFSLKPRLNNDRGTAILVAASIYDACHYYRLFQNTSFGRYCAVVTSYEPNHNAISREPPNSDERYKFDTYTQHVLKQGQTTKQYEDEAKRRFIEEPANLKLLIVVSKLLTGFDAPSCTYIYLDNELRDHNLFQAICRTNRLDGDDKDYGHIVDFKELFGDVQQAIAVYSSDELDLEGGSDAENNVHLKDWLDEGRKKLDAAREALRYLCEPVVPPREVEQFLHYFCGDAADPNALGETEALRVAFYKAVAVYVRAFAEIAQDLTEAGYSDAEAAALRKDVEFYGEIRSAIKKHSGEELDIKPYEADMRHLLNTYVQADPAADLGELGEMPLVELIVQTGIHDAIARKLNEQGRLSKNAIAEGIINNVRKTIIRERLTDPQFYAQMSLLLDDLIKQSRADAAAYEAFLRKAEALAKRLAAKQPDADLPTALHGKPEAAVIYNNLPRILAAADADPEDRIADSSAEYTDPHLRLALEIDRVMRERAPAGWKGDDAREAQVLNALFPLLNRDRAATQALFELIKRHDDAGLRQALRGQLLREGLRHFVTHSAGALLSGVGDRWARGELEIFEEHHFSAHLDMVLREAIALLPPGPLTPRVLLTTLPGEPHELGLVLVLAMLRLQGAACILLGAQTPESQIVAAAAAYRVDVVALSFSEYFDPGAVRLGVRRLRAELPTHVELWCGGRAAQRLKRPPAGVTVIGDLDELPAALASRSARHGAPQPRPAADAGRVD
jgi:type I restriction enzyme R subunit